MAGGDEYRECAECEYIEDCPHPTVDQSGSPMHPDVCNRKHIVKLTKRTLEDDNILIYGKKGKKRL